MLYCVEKSGRSSVRGGAYRDRNRFPFETPPDVLSDHDFGLCGRHPAGRAGADAAHRRRKPHMDAVSRGAVYLHLCGLCDGTGGTGHRQLLVRLRSDGDPAADPDRWLRRHHRGCNVSDALRQKHLTEGAQRHAGCHFRSGGGRHRAPDAVHPQGNVPCGTGRGSRAAAGVLPGLWSAGRVDGNISLRFRLLQRGL